MHRKDVLFCVLCMALAICGSPAGAGKAGKAQQEPNYGPAKGCTPPTLPQPKPQGVRIQSLPSGKRPNFIVVLTDDQGYDDVGLHQPQQPGGKPQWVSTPNLDRFMQQAMEFRNFYVSPMCSQSRAELLTGRDYQRTGTMLINGGYDYINRAESTLGNVMADGGYKTAHFGKWHNGRTLGYEPWSMGFQESWLPTSHVHLDNLMRHNGVYVQTKGLMEQDLMDTMLSYLTRREQDGAPFMVYYAPHAIHQGFLRPGQGPRWQRPAPEPYASKYKNMQPKLAGDTAQVWGMLEYMDDVLGRLFDYMERSKLRENTYVLVMSDNGAELFPEERRGYHRQRRIPSGMQGFKKSVEEGGIRNYLAVKGPGVPAGVLDYTLVSITDILPTIADLAGVKSKHLPWDGMSFANVLRSGPGTQLSTQQAERVVFEMSPHCWSPDTVPELGPDRKILKSQALLDFDKGGIDGTGFKRCIGVRYKDYKWLGETNKLYRLRGDSHVELPCNEVTGDEKEAVVRKLSAATKAWWQSLLSDRHSFNKPTFHLGLDGWSVTNILPDGAHERTQGRIELLPNGAAGFSKPGDSMCFSINVVTGGIYKVNILYTSKVQAQFRLSAGTYKDIQDGKAPTLQARLPEAGSMRGFDMGAFLLEASNGRPTEACLVMVTSSKAGSQVFDNLSNIRFTLETPRGPANTREAQPPAPVATQEVHRGALPTKAAVLGAKSRKAGRQQHGSSSSSSDGDREPQTAAGVERPGSLYAYDWIMFDSELEAAEEEVLHPFLAATAAMKRVERDAFAAAAARKAKEGHFVPAGGAAGYNNTSSAAQSGWDQLRREYLWPDGQGVLESMFTPYESEGIYTCRACQPDI